MNADSILVYSTVWCSDCKRAKKFFGEHRIPYTNIDIEQDAEAMAFVERVNQGKRIIPTIVFQDGSILVEPSNAQLATKLGLRTRAERQFYDCIIIGSGPAGLTAAFYLAREGVETLVIEKSGLGGQPGTTQLMDNIPGFDEGISGHEFAERLARQAKRFGAEILEAQEVTEINREDNYLCTTVGDGATSEKMSYGSTAVLLASGARYRRLHVPGEEELIGVNIHFCATCDGAFYKGKNVLVVGGGNSGFEEGLFLTRFARQVDIVDHNPQAKASLILQQKVSEKTNMTVLLGYEVREFLVKNHRLDGIIAENLRTGERKTWQYDGVFLFIGLTPNSDLLRTKAALDEYGFVVTDRSMMSSMRGVFAAGDVRAGSTKQAASAAGEGATAALMIRQYLKEAG